MKKLHNITEVRFENEFIIIKVDGQIIRLNISEVSQRLANASDEDKNEYSISPSGYGIHWPKIDEDISINGLISRLKA
jgi:hypothetical protein